MIVRSECPPVATINNKGQHMKVLIACEFSGRVRDAFTAEGHDATSCDILPTDVEGKHHIGDVLDILEDGWDLMVAHPPCTHLAVSGSRWFKDKREEQGAALEFVRRLMGCSIPRIAIENPISIISTHIRKPDQIIQPWMFGHGETKATCLWLKGLPRLVPTDVVPGRDAKIHRMGPSPDRWRKRSLTYSGVAAAMGKQWGHQSPLPTLRDKPNDNHPDYRHGN